MNTDTEKDTQRQRKAKNTAWLLGAIVFLVYIGFIVAGVFRS
jgi:hypothetical protein